MPLDWKDTTSYSQGGSREPKCWSVRLFGGMRLSVIRNHRDYPGQWIMSVTQIEMQQAMPDIPLGDIAAAQAKAIVVLRDHLLHLVDTTRDEESSLFDRPNPDPSVVAQFLTDLVRGMEKSPEIVRRVAAAGLEGTPEEIYRRLNAGGHPVRDGLILLGHSLLTPKSPAT